MVLDAYKGEIPLNLITGLSPILYNCLHESVWIIHTHPTSENKEMATCRLPIRTPDNLICHSEKCHWRYNRDLLQKRLRASSRCHPAPERKSEITHLRASGLTFYDIRTWQILSFANIYWALFEKIHCFGFCRVCLFLAILRWFSDIPLHIQLI